MNTREYIEQRSIPEPMSGCWIWLCSFKPNGYGQAWDGERVVWAHRLAFEAFNGPIPAGALVQHRCDQPWCVSPLHLHLGTDATNAWDKQRKGRAARKLGAHDVVTIRGHLAAGLAKRAIARAFGIDMRMGTLIERREAWRHVP